MFLIRFFTLLWIASSIVSVNVIAQNETDSYVPNRTEEISIDVQHDESSNLDITYTISEKFNNPSRGIFISLPKNQDGVWTNYQLLEYSVVDASSFQEVETSYSEIKEWDEFRLRFGEEDNFLPNGTYIYTFTIEATTNTEYKYNFIVLQDWLEEVGDIQVQQNNSLQCGVIECNTKKTEITINKNKNQIPGYLFQWHRFKGFINTFVVTSTIGYASWLLLAKNKPLGNTKNPNFKHPQVYPWEAEFIRTNGKSSIQKTMLGYLLWLSNQKYISLLFDKKQMKIHKLKKLPNILPSIFNQAINNIERTDLAKGIKKTKFSQSRHPIELDKYLIESTAKYYEQKKINYNWIASLIIIPIFIFFILLIVLNITFQNLLIGNSYLGIILMAYGFLFVFYVWIVISWANPNLRGTALRKEIKEYYYYLTYVEKHKLNFSNNLEGVQHYLDQIPFAANFGILHKLTDFLQNHFPNVQEASSIVRTSSIVSTAAFYPPSTHSSSSSFSSSSGGFSGGGGSW